MKPPCPRHKPTSGGYFKNEDKAEKGMEQRQCPDCQRWYFRGEFGKGWGNGIKQSDIGKIMVFGHKDKP